jgi:hypothetical protein
MKNKYKYINSAFCLLTFIACESHEQKADVAFKEFKIEKVIDIDSSMIFKDSINGLIKLNEVKKIVKLDLNNKYKNDLEAKVKANEITIAKLKTQYNSNTKVYRKIIRLEEANQLIMTQLKIYEEVVKKDRNSFEEKINREMNDIKLNINEYSVLK